jgi:hypothetical protein
MTSDELVTCYQGRLHVTNAQGHSFRRFISFIPGFIPGYT